MILKRRSAKNEQGRKETIGQESDLQDMIIRIIPTRKQTQNRVHYTTTVSSSCRKSDRGTTVNFISMGVLFDFADIFYFLRAPKEFYCKCGAVLSVVTPGC